MFLTMATEPQLCFLIFLACGILRFWFLIQTTWYIKISKSKPLKAISNPSSIECVISGVGGSNADYLLSLKDDIQENEMP